MIADMDFYALKSALEWQIELGVDEAIGEAPVNRFDEAGKSGPGKSGSNFAPVREMPVIPALTQTAPDIAKIMAGRCADLDALRDAMGIFEHCALKKGARNLVFSDGNPVARIMVIGEAPGREEDRIGLPFVGPAGQMLDKMFAAIGLERAGDGDAALYIANVMPWRPPHNRDPEPEEIAMMLPFLERHIALAAPEILVLMGNTACKAVLGRTGITRLRGTWTTAFDRPVLPMFHPAALLRDPQKKRDAWADLLALQAKLKEKND